MCYFCQLRLPNCSSLKLVDKFTYLGSSVSSTEKKDWATALVLQKKVCFLAHDYEVNLHNLKTHSSTCSHKAMCLVMLTASVMKFQVVTLDFPSVFLLGSILEREVFLRLSPDGGQSQVWKLKRCIHGLNDAPCSWFKRLNHKLNRKGIVWDPIGNLVGILVIHLYR